MNSNTQNTNDTRLKPADETVVHFHIVTLFPGYFEGPLGIGLMGRAAESALVRFSVYDLRDYSNLKHRQVDDEPYGGGPGMVLRLEPLVASYRAIVANLPAHQTEVLAFTPSGEVFCQSMAQTYATRCQNGDIRHIVLYCGRYEGYDERFLEAYVTRRLRVADAIYMGGEPAALIFSEAVSRLVPGVVGNPESLEQESFVGGRLDYPVYTRPREFEGLSVPDVLFSGDHAEIARWRRQASTRLWRKYRSE